MYAVTCLISTHVIRKQVRQALQHIPVVCWIRHQYCSVNSLNSSLTSLLFNLFQNALFTLVCVVCCRQHNMEGWLCTEHKNSNEFASVTLCEFIFGRHVCNYSVNLKLGSVLFFFFLGRGIKPPCNGLFCHRKLQSWEQPRLCTHTHTFSCVLSCYSQLYYWIDCFVWLQWFHREIQSCKPIAVGCQLNICHPRFHLFMCFVWLQHNNN